MGIRAFIAIELEKELKQAISQVTEDFLQAKADIKWVERQNIHITLKFLGSIEEKQIDIAKHCLSEIANSFNFFSMSLKGVGTFPEKGIPRVIWIGADEGKNELERCASLIENFLVKEGFKKEDRPFTPHTTIGRVRSPLNTALLKAKLKHYENFFFGSQLVKEISFFRSDLTKSGPIYSPIARFSFSH